MTNVRLEDVPALAALQGSCTIKAGSAVVKKIVPTFSEGASGEPVGVIGSSGYLEICMNKTSAARTLGIGRGTEVTVELG
jgi:S-adenosylmethionine hydrolase